MRTAIPASRHDTGSMPMAMLLTVVGVILSGVLASIVTVQAGNSRRAIRSQHALDAAQAGLDVAVGHIRAASKAGAVGEDRIGVLNGLPCSGESVAQQKLAPALRTAAFTGSVGVGGVADYKVYISYTRTRGGEPIECRNPGGPAKAAAFAELVAIGTDLSSDHQRTLKATYNFRTTNKNIPGGLIRVFRTATSKDLCLDAGSDVPNASTPLTVQPCSPGSAQQTFAYHPDLTIGLVTSVTDEMPLGMCLDAGPVPHSTPGTAVTFQPCGATTKPGQQWGFNDNANFEGTSDGVGLDGYCFNVQVPDAIGSAVVLNTGGPSCGGPYDNKRTFSPEAAVGAGAASVDTKQLVNYAQFGRCLDATNQNWQYEYMIVWPCKQAPDRTRVAWNQKWNTPGPADATGVKGPITTKPSYETFTTCLKSPLSTALGLYVTLEQCAPGPPTAPFEWTVFGDTGKYETSYTILDSNKNCLAAADPEKPGTTLYTYGSVISSVVVAPCDGSTLQKWNAVPEVLQATPLKNIRENEK